MMFVSSVTILIHQFCQGERKWGYGRREEWCVYFVRYVGQEQCLNWKYEAKMEVN